MSGLFHFVSAIPDWLAGMSLRGSFCIVVVLMITPLLRRVGGSRAAYWLWPIVFLQLLCPWMPVSPVGVFRQIPTRQPSSLNTPSRVYVTTSVSDVAAASQSGMPVHAQTPARIPWLPMIWGAGAAGICGLSLIRAVNAGRLAALAVDVTEKAALQTALRMFPNAPSRLQIRETDILRSPALCGMMRPLILLPAGLADRASPSDLHCILSHELGHLQRGDIFWRWVFLFARAIHWFNPLVWLAERRAREDQELACDELVLSRACAPSPQDYGELLLSAASGLYRNKVIAGVTMAESRAGLARRLRQLPDLKPRSWKGVACATAIAIALILLAAPGQSSVTPEKTSTATRNVQSSPLPAQGAVTPESYIRIEAKFVQIPNESAGEIPGLNAATGNETGVLALSGILSPGQFADVMKTLNGKTGIDLLASPSVAFRSGQRAVITVVRDFPYPTVFHVPQNVPGGIFTPPTPTEFETKRLGVILEVQGAFLPGNRIYLSLKPETTSFLGFVNYHADHPARENLDNAIEDATRPSQSVSGVINQPIFETRSIATSVTLQPGQTVILGSMEGMGKSLTELIGNNPPSDNASSGKQIPARSLYIFVTAKIMSQDQMPPPSKPSPKSNPAPYGTAVQDKPGYVTSPFAPHAGDIDVRGFPPGTEVKCPYTGKIFLVP